MDTNIERARLDDLPDVLALLTRCELPLAGLDDHVSTMVVARERGTIVGSAALEVYPDGALLRSVAVDPSRRGEALGRRLIAAALELAATHGVHTVFLLTMTAETYFPRFGFERIAREDAPASLRDSVQFRSACPSSAVVMRKHL